MLSCMESMTPPRSPDDPRSSLSAASAAAQRLTGGLRLPADVYAAVGSGVALQIGTAAYGIAEQTTAGLAVLLAGLAVLLLVVTVVLHRFRRTNGVTVDGLASQIVLGAGATSSTAYLAGLSVATWAAFSSVWWVVVVAAVAGGAGYAVGVRRWWRSYQQHPAAHARGASPRTLATLALLAGCALAALLVLR